MSRDTSGRAEAAAAIWSWRESGETRSSTPASAVALRRRGLLRALVAGSLGLVLLLFWSRLIGQVVMTVAGALALVALLSPLGLYAAIERGLGVLAHKTGLLLTWLLMAAIFYGVFTPFGWIFRRGRRDPLRRFREAELVTYWEGTERGRSASSSRRQAW